MILKIFCCCLFPFRCPLCEGVGGGEVGGEGQGTCFFYSLECKGSGNSFFDLFYWFKGFYREMSQISKGGCKKERSNIKKDWTPVTTMFNGTKDFRYHGL